MSTSSSTTPICIGNVRANLPILTGHLNYRRWYNAWLVVLRGAKYRSVVNNGPGKECRPSALKNEKEEDLLRRIDDYDEKNDIAYAALLSGVSEELQEIVGGCALEPESARVAMRRLKAKFDHETTTSTLHLFKNFIQLKIDEGDSVSDYISRFETSLEHLYNRCSMSSRPEAAALRAFLSVEEVKIMCLFLSFPPSLENVVDNLSTKENLRYADVNCEG